MSKEEETRLKRQIVSLIVVKRVVIARKGQVKLGCAYVTCTLPVSGRDAVMSVHVSSGADDIDTVHTITCNTEVELVVQVSSHQVAT